MSFPRAGAAGPAESVCQAAASCLTVPGPVLRVAETAVVLAFCVTETEALVLAPLTDEGVAGRLPAVPLLGVVLLEGSCWSGAELGDL